MSLSLTSSSPSNIKNLTSPTSPRNPLRSQRYLHHGRRNGHKSRLTRPSRSQIQNRVNNHIKTPPSMRHNPRKNKPERMGHVTTPQMPECRTSWPPVFGQAPGGFHEELLLEGGLVRKSSLLVLTHLSRLRSLWNEMRRCYWSSQSACRR